MLQKEYLFYQKKYNLQKPELQLFFLRMRPANFPTIRLAQLAMLINKSSHLFSRVKEIESLSEIKELLNVTANDYWHYHYVFDETTLFKKKKLGEQMINNIIINTLVPIMFAYGLHHKEERFREKAIAWLEEISSETNVITKGFEALQFSSKNSLIRNHIFNLKMNTVIISVAWNALSEMRC